MKFNVKGGTTNVSGAGRSINFDGDAYETDDQEEIEFLMSLSDDVVEAESAGEAEPQEEAPKRRTKKDE